MLVRLFDGQRAVLGESLVGAYLFGSAAIGSFERGASDIDTVVLVREDLTAIEIGALDALHTQLVRETPEWYDRIDAYYLSTRALAMSLTEPAPAARISPGEEFHAIEVDARWILDWYQVRTTGVVLVGPPIAEVMPVITREEYIGAVRGYLLDPDWLVSLDDAGDRCYAVLTMCRGLHSIGTGGYVSKSDGAVWASRAMPEYQSLIAAAAAWRLSTPNDRDDTTLPMPQVRQFVVDMQRRVRSAS